MRHDPPRRALVLALLTAATSATVGCAAPLPPAAQLAQQGRADQPDRTKRYLDALQAHLAPFLKEACAEAADILPKDEELRSRVEVIAWPGAFGFMQVRHRSESINFEVALAKMFAHMSASGLASGFLVSGEGGGVLVMFEVRRDLAGICTARASIPKPAR